MKPAIIITSDPKNGEEALVRRNDQVVESGQRSLQRRAPGHHLGVMRLRCRLRGDKRSAACGLPEIKDHALAGTPGLVSIRRYLGEGWQTFVF